MCVEFFAHCYMYLNFDVPLSFESRLWQGVERSFPRFSAKRHALPDIAEHTAISHLRGGTWSQGFFLAPGEYFKSILEGSPRVFLLYLDSTLATQ